MKIATKYKVAATSLALVAMNTGLYFDVKDGYETATRVGGDPVAHTKTGVGTKVVLEAGTAVFGIVGLAAAYTAVTAGNILTLPAAALADYVEGAKYRAALNDPKRYERRQEMFRQELMQQEMK